ncbi:uncharacterized protein MONBRDRAFT_33923 [Monosiga brevicollis MX1]|uniref:Uncharacterized protein n=1 Tax=Monosiga brevicollis TaxID=81824 RepID=A9V8H9_MONBE|nr:uncharacterized protein MONBRDRAFT_33923 [Monosiga brevicollis MX1]EDQ86086.1 predicted protein [Monosiga brevicollis MX1]|eukprot:XP_001749011.1 hypothetical protein [Monosiga brevicollis MX1]
MASNKPAVAAPTAPPKVMPKPKPKPAVKPKPAESTPPPAPAAPASKPKPAVPPPAASKPLVEPPAAAPKPKAPIAAPVSENTTPAPAEPETAATPAPPPAPPAPPAPPVASEPPAAPSDVTPTSPASAPSTVPALAPRTATSLESESAADAEPGIYGNISAVLPRVPQPTPDNFGQVAEEEEHIYGNTLRNATSESAEGEHVYGNTEGAAVKAQPTPLSLASHDPHPAPQPPTPSTDDSAAPPPVLPRGEATRQPVYENWSPLNRLDQPSDPKPRQPDLGLAQEPECEYEAPVPLGSQVVVHTSVPTIEPTNGIAPARPPPPGPRGVVRQSSLPEGADTVIEDKLLHLHQDLNTIVHGDQAKVRSDSLAASLATQIRRQTLSLRNKPSAAAAQSEPSEDEQGSDDNEGVSEEVSDDDVEDTGEPAEEEDTGDQAREDSGADDGQESSITRKAGRSTFRNLLKRGGSKKSTRLPKASLPVVRPDDRSEAPSIIAAVPEHKRVELMMQVKDGAMTMEEMDRRLLELAQDYQSRAELEAAAAAAEAESSMKKSKSKKSKSKKEKKKKSSAKPGLSTSQLRALMTMVKNGIITQEQMAAEVAKALLADGDDTTTAAPAPAAPPSQPTAADAGALYGVAVDNRTGAAVDLAARRASQLIDTTAPATQPAQAPAPVPAQNTVAAPQAPSSEPAPLATIDPAPPVSANTGAATGYPSEDIYEPTPVDHPKPKSQPSVRRAPAPLPQGGASAPTIPAPYNPNGAAAQPAAEVSALFNPAGRQNLPQPLSLEPHVINPQDQVLYTDAETAQAMRAGSQPAIMEEPEDEYAALPPAAADPVQQSHRRLQNEMQVGLSQRLSQRLRTSNDSELNGAIEDALTMIADMAAEASTLPAEAGPQSIEEFRQSLIYDDV